MDRFDRLAILALGLLLSAIMGVILIGDRVGVSVVEFAPLDQSTPPVTTNIQITFVQTMNKDSVEANVHIEPKVAGSTLWSTNTFVFQPDVPLIAGQSYTVTLAQGTQSESGRSTAQPVSWTFAPRTPTILYLLPLAENPLVRSLWATTVDGAQPRHIYTGESEYGVYAFAPRPDGTEIALAILDEDITSDIWIINSDGTNLRQLIECSPGSCDTPVWSPDGTLLAYERENLSPSEILGPSHIWLYDRKSGETAPLFEDSQIIGFGPTWSGDGSKFAFFDGNIVSIRVVELSSGGMVTIPTKMGEAGSLAPDGDAIVYAEFRSIGDQFLSELRLGHIGQQASSEPLLAEPQEDQNPAWSPTGEWIAFNRRSLDPGASRGGQLYLFNPETDELRLATPETNYSNSPFVWDPSGQWMVLQRNELGVGNSVSEIWVYSVSTGDLRLLVENGVFPQWLP